LAACLGISASAVTQIKKGVNQLSAEQVRAFMEYLAVDESAAEEICCTIFQAGWKMRCQSVLENCI